MAYPGVFEGRKGWWFDLDPRDLDKRERLKRAVPADERTYDPEKREWWIADSAFERACTVLPGLRQHLAQATLF